MAAMELEEDIDLPMEWRKYVLEIHPRLATVDHYEVLGVPRDAERKAIKQKYFELAARVHPDRYFQKRLGAYKSKMEYIFARVSIAYETLSDKDKRAEYDKTLPSLAQSSGALRAAPAVRAPVSPEIAARRAAAMEALKQRFTDGKGRAKQHVELGNRARAAGDFLAASEAYRQALAFMPGDAEVKAAFDEVQRAAAEKLVEANQKKAMLEEKFGRWAEAVEAWEKVAVAKPNDEFVRTRLAQALARAARDG
jgi:curved DNA-binding protein CbpA